jgi:murein DD-endopeptidase MepM/ murein hydrolase activator NlpD
MPGIRKQPYNGFGTLRNDSKGSGEWHASRGTSLHKGIDISGVLLQLVGAWRAGTVTRAQDNVSGYGVTVEITHGDGSVSKYHHLDSRHVKRGDKVGEGDPIGQLGQSGNATGTNPHVDFEIVRNGRFVNPVAALNSPCPK